MAHPTALLDANVLYPAGLRDFLLRLATGRRCEIHREPRTANEHVDALEHLGLARTASLVRPYRNSI